jgi:hypothetical protein
MVFEVGSSDIVVIQWSGDNYFDNKLVGGSFVTLFARFLVL